MTSERSIRGPPSQVDNKVDYFSCYAGAIKEQHQTLPNHDNHRCTPPPLETATKGGCFDDNAGPAYEPTYEKMFQIQAASIRTMLHIPPRFEALVFENQHSVEAWIVAPNHSQRRHYSFSSSDSGVNFYHVEDVGNPIPSYIPQPLASSTIESIMANMALVDSGVDICDQIMNVEEPAHDTTSTKDNGDSSVSNTICNSFQAKKLP